LKQVGLWEEADLQIDRPDPPFALALSELLLR
jgi:hypothetical protein